MQNNLIVGNIARINRIEGTNKVFITIADHRSRKTADGKWEQKTNYVPVEGFLPEGLNLQVGQLVAVKFAVTGYQTKDGKYKVANDIENIDVTLRSPAKKNTDAAPAADTAEPEMPTEPEKAADAGIPEAPADEAPEEKPAPAKRGRKKATAA